MFSTLSAKVYIKYGDTKYFYTLFLFALITLGGTRSAMGCGRVWYDYPR
jgi:hypothetical protein